MPRESRDKQGHKGKKDAFTFDPEDLVLITDEKHPLYDERVHLPVDEAMVLNMMFAPDGVPQGVIEPPVVVRDPETGKMLVAVGRQRVKAAREANKRLKKAGLEPFWVTVIIQKLPTHRAMAMIASENAHRTDETPLGIAKKMQRYLDIGRDEVELTTIFGLSLAAVKNYVSLLGAPADVRNAVEAGKISVSDAYKLAKMEPAEAKEKVKELVEHAPREPGKKRSKNSKKAREIVSGKKDEPKISRKAEDAVATDIAAWIDANYEMTENFPDLLKLLRAGKWREIRGEK